MDEDEATWPEWVDPLGQTYRPGDWVAVATVNGRSPQLVVAEVERINRRRPNGELITERRRIGSTWEFQTVMSCTVRARPLIDGRNFTRYGGDRSVVYQFPGNIVKVPNLAAIAKFLAESCIDPD